MRKILSFSVIFMFFVGTISFSNGQTLQLLNENNTIVSYGDTIVISGTPQTAEMIAHMRVKNTSTSSVSVTCTKTYIDVVPGTSNVFCWANMCYPPNTFVSNAMNIEPNTIVDDFSGHYYPSNQSGISIIQYTFKIPHGDSAWFFVKYDATGQGIESNSIASLSKPFPNPAHHHIYIPYDIKTNTHGQIEIYDILGKLKLNMIAPAHNHIVDVPLEDFNNGIYFVQLKLNNKIIRTEKFVVKH